MPAHKIRAAIIGGAGYTGGEAIRLLLQHPNVHLGAVHSRSQAGEPLYAVHGDLLGETDLYFTDDIPADADVLFCCLGHGETKAFLETTPLPDHLRIIDLSQDFRLSSDAAVSHRQFVYGLPEWNREAVRQATAVANPGCFATAIQLALLPLAAAGRLGEVHATGITGSTGAGQKLQSSSHFSWRSGNIQAYKALDHQHRHEVLQTLRALQPEGPQLRFMPWRGDFTRGIYISAYTETELDLGGAYRLYEDYYATAPFTHVSRKPTDLKQVVNTNKCLLHLEVVDGHLVIHSAIDNLLKGASGQAVQNMNLMFGLPEDAGLRLKALSF